MLKEFKKFIARGNVIDLAVGIILGTAFTAIVNSLVQNVIMPPLGILIGEVDFSRLSIVLRPETAETPAVTMQIGLFINVCVQFLIIAFTVFLLVRAVNRLSERVSPPEEEVEPAAPAEPSNDEKLLVAIDELTATIRSLRRRPKSPSQPNDHPPE
jgi:large conductance mechanosensitive channel